MSKVSEKASAILNYVKKKKKIVIPSVIVLLLISAIYMVSGIYAKPANSQESVPQVSVKRGDVTETISATGTVQASTQIKLNFVGGTGKLTSVNVKVGDQVKAGQTLATLDDKSAKAQIANAQANVASAQARLSQARQGATSQSIAVQQTNVDKAKVSIQGAEVGYKNQQVIYNDRTQAYQQVANAENQVEQARIQLESAKAGLTSANARLTTAKEGASDNELDQAEANVDAMEAAVNSAVYQYDNAPTYGQRVSTEVTLNQAKVNLANAEKQLEELRNLPDPNLVIQAQAAVDQAQAGVDQAEQSYRAAQTNLTIANQTYNNRTQAKSQLDQAKNNVDQAKANYNSSIAQLNQTLAPPDSANIEAAKAAVKQAQAQLQQQQIALDNLTLKAPIDGLVVQVNGNVGEQPAGNAPLVVINSDPKEMQILAKVSQSDVGKLSAGLDAEFTTSSYHEKKFSGKVILIYPEAVTQNGVTMYDVLLSVNDSEGLLKPGMTTDAVIKAGTRNNVLFIPATALKAQGGKDGVYIVENNGNLRFQPVTIGMFSSDRVEIVSGLKEGDKIALRVVDPNKKPAASGGFGGGPFDND